MTATYPVSIHTYTDHRDYVEYVLADHVNSLQGEVTAIEQTIGAAPNVWTYTGDTNFSQLGDLSAHYTWNTVRDRIDSLQAHIVRLERLAGIRITAYPGAVAAPPVVVIRNPGQSLMPSPILWTTYDMSVADFDSGGIFTGGSSVACPQTGWWSISATIVTDVPDGPAGTTHTVSNRILLANNEVATHSSSRTWGTGGQHRINLTYAGPWTLGDLLFVQSQNNPTPAAAPVSSRMQLSCTYVRATV